ncbi:MAG: hypothetical protein OEM63_13355, partial [Gammaproteobacteria bacterium]|nr:hypothetical protein [Gammaproteobacteria bacterium]
MMKSNKRAAIAVLALLTMAGCGPSDEQPAEPQLEVDVLIAGGLIYDGSGSVPVNADIGIS